MSYDHIQRGYFHWLLYVLAVVAGGAAWLLREEARPLMIVLIVAGIVMAVLALSFHYLRIRDSGTHLEVRFGPLPLMGASIRYASITSAEASRSSFIDGWGIHWVPGRGWTYNIWGYDCVVLEVDGKTTRIGTNDVENLLAFLQTKLPQ